MFSTATGRILAQVGFLLGFSLSIEAHAKTNVVEVFPPGVGAREKQTSMRNARAGINLAFANTPGPGRCLKTGLLNHKTGHFHPAISAAISACIRPPTGRGKAHLRSSPRESGPASPSPTGRQFKPTRKAGLQNRPSRPGASHQAGPDL